MEQQDYLKRQIEQIGLQIDYAQLLNFSSLLSSMADER